MVQATLALVALLLSGTGLVAQTTGSARFHIAGGVMLPQGSFNDAFKTGWLGDGGLSFGLSGIPFMVRIDGFYSQNIGDQTQTGNDVKQIFIGGLIGGEYVLGHSGVRPYLVGQIGLANARLKVGPLDDTETKFTFAGGFGIEFGAGGLRLFAEAKYQQVMTSDESAKMIPIVAGFRFGGR
jgi:hypothetical protein